MKYPTKSLSIILCLAFLGLSCAHVQKNKSQLEPGEPDFNTFAVSTEMEIGKAWPIINQAPRGAFVSVGGERSFRLFSMSDNATVLYLLDISPRVLRFATINRELLRAKTLKEYKNLRFDADFSAWQKLQKGQQVEHLLSADDFSWWKREVDPFAKDRYTLPEMLNKYESDILYQDYLRFYQGFKRLFTHVGPTEQKEIQKLIMKDNIKYIEKRVMKSGIILDFSLSELEAWREKLPFACFTSEYLKNPGPQLDIASIINFKLGNYLFDEKLYKMLHHASVNKHIYIKQLNLADNDMLNSFIESLKSKGETVALLDLNNTYRKEYIGDPDYMKIVAAFASVAHDDSILLAMSNVLNFMCTQYSSYFGFRYSLLKTLPKDFPFGRYLEVLPGKVINHMDQKLYSLYQLPPYFTNWQDLPAQKI